MMMELYEAITRYVISLEKALARLGISCLFGFEAIPSATLHIQMRIECGRA